MDELDYVIAIIEPWLEHYFNAGPERLQSIELVAVCVWTLRAQVNNGGFAQYYYSSDGQLALQAVESLEAIGANRTALLLKAANDEFGHSAPPADRVKRGEVLEAILDRVSFSPLEQEFYRDDEQLICRLAEYLRVHLAAQA